MFRKDLIPLLLHNPLGVADLAKLCGAPMKEIDADLRHLMKSLKHSEYQVRVHPAACRKCSFVFSAEKLTRPGKCPQCRGTWIEAPLIEILGPAPTGREGEDDSHDRPV
jgi:predicted Zn-ribbon and HTH transcriptional regulator